MPDLDVSHTYGMSTNIQVLTESTCAALAAAGQVSNSLQVLSAQLGIDHSKLGVMFQSNYIGRIYPRHIVRLSDT